MDRSDRAKQFMPFAAVTGLYEALRQKEREVEAGYGIIDKTDNRKTHEDEDRNREGED